MTAAVIRDDLTDLEAGTLIEHERTIAKYLGPPGSRERRYGVKRSDRRSHDVYVHLSDDGIVLYVGMSLDALARSGQHRSSGWWQQVATIRVEHLPNRQAALDREAELVASLRPPYNRAATS